VANAPVPPRSFSDAPDFPGPTRDVQRKLSVEYRPWRKFRFVAGDLATDAGVAWDFAKALRRLFWREIPIQRAEGGTFGVCAHPALARSLHLIDRASGDDILSGSSAGPLNSAMRKRMDALFRGGELIPNRMRLNTVMSEAAESSMIEGASATRQQALDMLRTGRAPQSIDERMILNNYQAMQLIKRHLNSPLNLDLILELQAMLTAATLTTEDACGRFRLPSEIVRVVDTRDESVILTPPPADHVRPLLKAVCDFVNRDRPEVEFLHPIVTASIVHFLVGYIHPFVDGNGRTARALFYWYALRHGYAVFEFLSISEIIRQGFARYPQAYIDSESDDGDLTYFVIYHLEIIEQALDRFAEHLASEDQRVERSKKFLLLAKDLNMRQRLLLEHASRHPDSSYTVKSHMNSNGVSVNTSRADLEDLVRRRLMVTTKRAKEVVFLPAPDLNKRLARKGI
jgi:Fic family protein